MVQTNLINYDRSDAYSGYKNKDTKSVYVLYDDKRIHDEEKMYEFRKDGSATAVSCAWGNRSELPPGTFSDMLAKMPKTEELNAELAQQLANVYDNAYSKIKKA